MTVESCGDGSRIVRMGELAVRVPADAPDSWIIDAAELLRDAKEAA